MPVQEFAWTHQQDGQWAARVTLRMLWHHNAPVEAVDEAIGQAHQAVGDSGRTAEELFGPADAYAAEAVREFAPAEQRAAADLDGGAPLLTYDAVLFSLCLGGLAICAVLVSADRSAVTVTPAGVAVALGLLGAGTAIVAAQRARFNGYLVRAALLSGLAGVAVVAGATVAFGGPGAGQPRGQLSVALVAAAAVAAGVVGWNLPTPPHADPETAVSANEWFARLYGLPRGRWYLSRNQALRLTDEACHHWQRSGTSHPREEFGAPPVHALHLVGGTRDSRSGRFRVQAWTLPVLLVVAADRIRWRLMNPSGDTADVGFDTDGWQRMGAVAAAATVLLCGWSAANEWRTSTRLRRRRI